MITKSNKINVSNNESLADASRTSICEQTDSNSSGSINPENTTAAESCSSERNITLDSNNTENEIKNMLGRDVQPTANSNTTPKPGNKIDQIKCGILTAEDSCNAVDNKISSDSTDSFVEVTVGDLSFNGKIKGLSFKQVNSRSSQGESSTDIPPQIGLESLPNNQKVCKDKLNESFEILTKENSSLMHYNNEKSPDLFGDEDDNDNGSEDDKFDSVDTLVEKSYSINASTANRPVDLTEKMLLKRIQASISGVLPPPSVTISRIDINRMLTLYKENEARYTYREEDTNAPADTTCSNFVSKPTHTPAELSELQWPEILHSKAHGVHYNRSVMSEKFELLGLKYVERYIGAETYSTYSVTRSPSSAKKRTIRTKMLNQSPGSRLSHLARRRQVFSSANLLNTSVGSVTASLNASSSTSAQHSLRLCNRQILLDPKKSINRRKMKGKTPKRRTPGSRKTPRRKTPSSSAKKKRLSLPLLKPQQPASRESSKRALFQSPPNESTKAAHALVKTVSSEVASRIQKSKRALFSPPKRAHRLSSMPSSNNKLDLVTKDPPQRAKSSGNSGVSNLLTGEPVDLEEVQVKRKRSLDDDERHGRSEKLPRIESINEEDLTPRSLKLARSQSFCVGVQNTRSFSENSFGGKALFRATSEVMFPDSISKPVTMLTENHKKKLLWAVSQALQSKQITVKHEHFKQYASNLARVVKRLFLEFNDPSVTSTSEKLLRSANKHVFEVIQGHSVDDIYFREKTRILNSRNTSKLHGYIAPEEYELRKQSLKRLSSSSISMSESSIDTPAFFSTSSQQLQLSQSSIFSQSSEFINQLSQSSIRTTQPSCTITEPSASQSILSENTALRENINCELRQKSAQKQISFSGKDQKNLSPYADNKAGVAQTKGKLLVGGALSSSILKAKRQISFE